MALPCSHYSCNSYWKPKKLDDTHFTFVPLRTDLSMALTLGYLHSLRIHTTLFMYWLINLDSHRLLPFIEYYVNNIYWTPSLKVDVGASPYLRWWLRLSYSKFYSVYYSSSMPIACFSTAMAFSKYNERERERERASRPRPAYQGWSSPGSCNFYD